VGCCFGSDLRSAAIVHGIDTHHVNACQAEFIALQRNMALPERALPQRAWRNRRDREGSHAKGVHPLSALTPRQGLCHL
jgi:hypothetical protein